MEELERMRTNLEQTATRRVPGATGEFLYSTSLAREVAEKGQAALVLDAQTDARFAAAESILSSGVRTLVAAPLLAPDANLGMIVLSSRVHVRRYSEEDMELLVALASVAALRIHNISLPTVRNAAGPSRIENRIARRVKFDTLLAAGQKPAVPLSLSNRLCLPVPTN